MPTQAGNLMRKAMPAEFPGPPGCIQGGETSREVNQKGLFAGLTVAEENGKIPF